MSRRQPRARGTVEAQRAIGFGEMIVRPHLDRTVAAIGDPQRDDLAAGIDLDVAGRADDFPGNHDKPPLLSGWTALI
jgi:hypothetical protein